MPQGLVGGRVTRPQRSLLPIVLLGVAVCLAFAGHAAGETVYFLVGEWPGQEVYYDSYVLPLEDPDDIAHARDLIEHGPEIGDAIAVAYIQAGADGINRDYLAPGAPEWSWHVTGFACFAWGTIEILDGNPWLVEADVEEWIRITHPPSQPDNVGMIGFWSYTVVAELSPIPEPSWVGVAGVILMFCIRSIKGS
jgi:hypothetical protein